MKNVVSLLIFLSLFTACTKKSDPNINAQFLSVALGGTVNLGEVPFHTPKLFTVDLTNPSSDDLTGPAMVPENSLFSLMAGFNCPVLKAKSKCTLKIYLSSAAQSGQLNELLSIGGQSVTLSATILPPPPETPNLAVPSDVNFGIFNRKNVVLKSISIRNLGAQAVTSTASLNLEGGSIIYDVCSQVPLKPKNTCVIKVALDLRNSSLDEAAPIFGSLTYANASISLMANLQEAVSFEESAVGLSEGDSISVSVGVVNPPYTLFKILNFVNDGDSPTTSVTAEFTPGAGIFLLNNTCLGVVLNPGGSCSIKVAMPSSTGYGNKTATLNLGTYQINLTGSVIPAVIPPPVTPVTSYSVPGLPPDMVIVNLPPGCNQSGSLVTCAQPTVIPPPKLACAGQHIYVNGQCVLVNQGDSGSNCPSGQYFDGENCLEVTYEARSWSPYSPVPAVCGGIVHQHRNILTCFRVDTDQQVSNSFCVDPLANIDTPSPAGAISNLNIVGGVQHRGCAAGSSDVMITGVDCVPGYLQQGDLCVPYNLQVPSTKGFNGTVSSIVTLSTGEVVYGGSFDSFTDTDNTIYTLKGIAKFNASGQIDTNFINNVGTNIPNAAGGFMVVDGDDNIYGITSSGSLWKMSGSGIINNTFKNNTNNKVTGVKALALDGQGNLIIGGGFSSWGGIANNARGIAKLSTDGVFNQAFSDNLDVVPGTKAASSGITGALGTALSINALAVDSSGNIYAGGQFYGWNGQVNNAQKILKLSSSGVFNQTFSDNGDAVFGTKANNSGFYSSDNAAVMKILVDGDNLYVGGNFSHYKGISFAAMRIAKLSTSGVFDTAFSNNLDVTSGSHGTNSGFDNQVRDIFLDNGSLYLVGDFNQFKNTVNNAKRIAKLSTNGVFDQSFSNSIDGIPGVKGNGSGFNSSAYTITIVNHNQIYVGGAFDSFKNSSAKYTAKFSIDGTPIPYLASSSLFNGAVADIKQDLEGNTYFVGSFTYYNGKYAPYILKLNSNFQVDESFMTNMGDGVNSAVSSIAIDVAGNIYVGGGFTTYQGGVANSAAHILKLSSNGIVDTSFMNNLDATPGVKNANSGFSSNITVLKIGPDGNLYAGGSFTKVKNLTAAKFLAKVSLSGVLDLDFISNYGSGLNTGAVYGLGFDDNNNLYVTGTFTSWGGVANNANGLAKFSIGGVFDQAFSNNLDVTPGVKAATSGFVVSPGTNQGQVILVEGNSLFVGGSFNKFQNINFTARGISKFTLDGILDNDFRTTMGTGLGASATISSLDSDGESLYIGGSFSGWNNVSFTARNLAKVSLNGALNLDFMQHMNADYVDSAHPGTYNANSGFGSAVGVVWIGIHGELLIGGQFSNYKQFKYERAVILNADGTLPLQ